jgi:hypothetical protein
MSFSSILTANFRDIKNSSDMLKSIKMDNIMEANSIFQQPWWLYAVANGQWKESAVQNKQGEIVARMPYIFIKNWFNYYRYTTIYANFKPVAPADGRGIHYSTIPINEIIN